MYNCSLSSLLHLVDILVVGSCERINGLSHFWGSDMLCAFHNPKMCDMMN
jgi:hypothetical protein